MKKHFLSSGKLWLRVFLMLVTTSLGINLYAQDAPGFSLKFTQIDDCVPAAGLRQANFMVTLKLTEAHLGIASMYFVPPSNVSIDWRANDNLPLPSSARIVLEDGVDGKKLFKITNTPLQPTLNKQEDAYILGALTFTVPADADKDIAVPFTVVSFGGLDPTITLSNWTNPEYPKENIVLKVTKGFNFNVINPERPSFSVAEGDSIDVKATNTTVFNATVWDNEAEEIVPAENVLKTNGADDYYVMFKNDDGKWKFLSDEDKKKAEVNYLPDRGILSITPKKDYLNDNPNTPAIITVNAIVARRSAWQEDAEPVSFQVELVPVDDQPVVNIISFGSEQTIGNITKQNCLKEGNTSHSYKISLTDPDTALNNYAVKLFFVDGDQEEEWAEIAGSTISSNYSDEGLNGYGFIENKELSYDYVQHPNYSKQFQLVAKVMKDNEVVATSGPFEFYIVDEDRIPEPRPEVILVDANGNELPKAKKEDYLNSETHIGSVQDKDIYLATNGQDIFIQSTTPEDPDGDVVTLQYVWETYTGKYHDDWGTKLSADSTSKKDLWHGNVYVTTNPYGDGDSTHGDSVQKWVYIINSKPVGQNANLFIRKTDNADEAKGEIKLTATDADGDALTFSIVNNGSKGTASIEDGTLIYTVTDNTQEFYGDGADVITLKANDGEADSEEFTVTVSYRDNPPAEIAVTAEAPAALDEVDETGAPSTFTASITATDSAEVTPAGIKNIAWTMLTADGAPVEGWILNDSSADLDALSKTASCTVTLPGYDTIKNAADGTRPKTQNFKLKVVVTDALDATSEKVWELTVSDVDRAPTAPATVTVSPAAELKVKEVPEPSAEGATDADGDAITYVYAWNCGDKTDIDTRLKGETWTLTATPTTKPYGGDDVRAGEAATTTFTVINTAPVLAATDTQPWASDQVLESTAKTAAISAFVTVSDDDDADMAAGFDYAFTVSDSSAVKGTFSIDGDNVTFTPEKNQVGIVTFTVTATEKSETAAVSNVVELSFEVLGVNSAPILYVADQYLTPQDCGQQRNAIFNLTMGDSADEATQSLTNYTITIKEDADSILDGAPTLAYDDNVKTLTVSYAVKADAADKMGKSAILTINVTDNGGTANDGIDTASFDFKVVLGATPWYPTVEINSANLQGIPAGTIFMIDVYQLDGDDVYRSEEDDAIYQGELLFTMRGRGTTILPADYLDYSDGLLPGTYRYDFFLWTPVDGRLPFPVASQLVQIADYAAPTAGTVKTTLEDDGNTITFDISMPLSQGYVMNIRKDGEIVQTINKRFTTPTDGQLLPEASFKLAFFQPGNYTVDLQGYNPQGDGDVIDDIETAQFTIENDEDQDVFFDGLDGFVPSTGKIIVTETDTTVVDFQWPTLKAGYTYLLEVFDRNGLLAAKVEAGTATTARLQLNSKDDINNYLWRVSVSNSQVRNVSASLTLMIVKKSDAPIVTGVIADGNGIKIIVDTPIALDGLTYDIMYYSVKGNAWVVQSENLVPTPNAAYPNGDLDEDDDETMRSSIVDLPALGIDLGFTTSEGDGIYLRAKRNGKSITKFTPYILTK